MSGHVDTHPLAGQTVKLADQSPKPGDPQGMYRVEDWWDRVAGQSWMWSSDNPAALKYAIRSGLAGLPTDDEVVYGKDQNGLGHLVHVSELITPTDELDPS